MAMMDPSIDEKKIDRIIDKCKAELNQSYYKYGNAENICLYIYLMFCIVLLYLSVAQLISLRKYSDIIVI